MYGVRGGGEKHGASKSDFLKSSEFCAGCHQFNFLNVEDRKSSTTPVPSQNTYKEWLDYRAKGGQKTCQNCHMPNGEHSFHAYQKLARLQESVTLKAFVGVSDVLFAIGTNNIGHRFPTGDLFRRLTLEVADNKDAGYRVVAVFRRELRREMLSNTPGYRLVIGRDTTLLPGQVQRVSVPKPGVLGMTAKSALDRSQILAIMSARWGTPAEFARHFNSSLDMSVTLQVP
jgi:hypothetical protein